MGNMAHLCVPQGSIDVQMVQRAYVPFDPSHLLSNHWQRVGD
jgi:hypothetical protein